MIIYIYLSGTETPNAKRSVSKRVPKRDPKRKESEERGTKRKRSANSKRKTQSKPVVSKRG